MLLVLDIGNSNIVAGVFDGAKLAHSWRFATNTRKTSDEYAVLLEDFFKQAGLKPGAIKDAILASVVPPLDGVLQDALWGLFKLKAMVVGHKLDLGLSVGLRNPDEVGADRLVNAVAAFHAYPGPLLVLDFGTATTVDAVSADGVYLGGAIAPGVAISMEALFSRTARLPRIDMEPPDSPIGGGTLQALRSGIYYGTLGGTRELCARIGAELKRRDGRTPKLIATGGLSHWLPAAELGITEVVPDLTLRGLYLIWKRNRRARGGRPAPKPKAKGRRR
ncbi:MAG TPA: type III pantothenate kinase [bacterium]|jgi:type III pantothenate kinase|nr:type III pantothenate kinase [bacterium]